MKNGAFDKDRDTATLAALDKKIADLRAELAATEAARLVVSSLPPAREPPNPAPADAPKPKPSAGISPDAIENIKRLATDVATAQDALRTAQRNRDAAGIEKAVAAIWRARREGGALLARVAGKVRFPMAGGAEERKCMRKLAALPRFEKRLKRYIRKTVGGLTPPKPTNPAPPAVATSSSTTVTDAKTKQARNWRSKPIAGVTSKIGAWGPDEAGNLTRTVEGVAAPA